MRNIRHAVLGATVALLIASVSGCNYIVTPKGDPNAVAAGSVTLDQLFTTIQVNWFFMNESELGRMPSIWLQQMYGAQRQFSGYNSYIYGEDVGSDTWSAIYRHGGLQEVKEAEKMADAEQRPGYKGILEVYEAYLAGTAADVWGNVPYSQAADSAYTHPQLDDQMAIYAAVEKLLDQAITDLGGAMTSPAGPSTPPDLVFGADGAQWIAVAHTLKARYYMHMAEKDGSQEYTLALAQAQQGITDPSGNWKTIHTTASTESNDWFQFMTRDRSGYITPNPYMVTLLKNRHDPRLTLYFAGFNIDTTNAALDSTQATDLNIPEEANWDEPMVSCSENYFIMAEAEMQVGTQAAAQTAYENGLGCQDKLWGVTITPINPVTLPDIMMSKYIALFLNPEIWNDYKRTCYPQVVPPAGAVKLDGHLQVPPGFYYPGSERQTNPNIPPNTDAVLRHENDPNYCTYAGVN